FNHPGFLDPIVDGVREAMTDLSAAGHDAGRVKVLFSTHSIPLTMTEATGPAGAGADGQGGWYAAEQRATGRNEVEQLGETRTERPEWQLVYQSRSGSPHVPWLEPDINDVIEEIGTQGSADAVVVVPIGFVTDHVEVIWDLDTEAKESAEEQQLAFR